MYRKKSSFVLCLVVLLSLFGVQIIQAQEQGEWSAPYRLSVGNTKAWSNVMATDTYGFVHVFWAETDLAEGQEIIQYSRFDGEIWSTPIDIYATRPGDSIGRMSVTVDRFDTLHLVWSGGTSRGPVHYIRAPAHKAASARNWSSPLEVEVPADAVSLKVDSKGVLHLLYSVLYGPSGLYYIRSEDQGVTWSEPNWFDPDIPDSYYPDGIYVELILDKADNLHTVWYYLSLSDEEGDWVRYTHSLDGGDSWSIPFTIDKNEVTGHRLGFAGPVLAVHGEDVLIVWAGGDLNYRNYRFSTNSGQTWSVPQQFMGGLNGQARDHLAVDSRGRIHFLGQIRFPKAIWHAIWDKDHWSPPTTAYWIAREAFDPEEATHIHAHSVHSVFRTGNDLVMTFTNSPAESELALYVMNRTLNDTFAQELVPTPTPELGVTNTPTPKSRATAAIPTITPIPRETFSSAPVDERQTSPTFPLVVAILPVFGIIVVIVMVKTLF